VTNKLPATFDLLFDDLIAPLRVTRRDQRKKIRISKKIHVRAALSPRTTCSSAIGMGDDEKTGATTLSKRPLCWPRGVHDNVPSLRSPLAVHRVDSIQIYQTNIIIPTTS
jgi:hypothetical protein